jgi:spoIIIJ-associated protein
MSDTGILQQRVQEFVQTIVDKMGLELTVEVEPFSDGVRVNLRGDAGEPLLRRKGEGLDALQHVVNTAFRDELPNSQRLVVDCQGFRKAKDNEIQQIARFLMDKARATGQAQEIGPLNSYARRLVHLEVATAPDLESESQGDGAAKVVIITRKIHPR